MRKHDKRVKRLLKYVLVTLMATVIIFALNLMSSRKIELDMSEIAIHYIDVGQGTCAFIDNGDKDIIIDAGGGESADKTVNYINSMGGADIEYIFLFHPHEDHIGGADEIFESFDVANLVMPDKETDTACYTEMMKSAREENSNIIYAESGDIFNIGELRIKVLSPDGDADYGDELNLYSLVIQLTYGEKSFVFCGDAEEQNESYILEEYEMDIECDILSVGHHGSSTSSSSDFIDMLDPEIAVISCGEGNEYGHPHTETLETLDRHSVKVYRTDYDSTVVFICDGDELKRITD